MQNRGAVTAALLTVAAAAACVVAWVQWRRLDTLGLRVLVWHGFSWEFSDRSTISRAVFERQLDWIAKRGYEVIPFSKVIGCLESGTPLPGRALVLSFDDSYRSFRDIALPCLERRGWASLLLIPGASLTAGETGSWSRDLHMSVSEVQALPESVELGNHSWAHQDFGDMNPVALRDDIARSANLGLFLGRTVLPVLAYPFGKYPRNAERFDAMRTALQSSGIRFGLRIGYGINRWPLKDAWRVRRIVVHGNDSFYDFRCKLRVGRIRL
jgi:peptidoglycan/xylan/chitin deacetylase (PgdA/CDA1 family)